MAQATHQNQMEKNWPRQDRDMIAVNITPMIIEGCLRANQELFGERSPLQQEESLATKSDDYTSNNFHCQCHCRGSHCPDSNFYPSLLLATTLDYSLGGFICNFGCTLTLLLKITEIWKRGLDSGSAAFLDLAKVFDNVKYEKMSILQCESV